MYINVFGVPYRCALPLDATGSGAGTRREWRRRWRQMGVYYKCYYIYIYIYIIYFTYLLYIYMIIHVCRDAVGAEEALVRALEADPYHREAAAEYAALLTYLGRKVDAADHAKLSHNFV